MMLVPLIGLAQSSTKTETKPVLPVSKPVTDSTAMKTISIKELRADIEEFVKIINSMPHSEYIKVTPDVALAEFFNWKARGKKQPQQ